MRLSIIAITLITVGCEQNSFISTPKPTVAPTQPTLKAFVQEVSPPVSKRTEYGLSQGPEGFTAAKWDESRIRYYGEPCIDSWAIRSNPGKMSISGTTRSTNAGFLVGDVNIYGGNLAISEKLTLLGKSDATGSFAINVATGLACDYLYTGGQAEPLIEYSITKP